MRPTKFHLLIKSLTGKRSTLPDHKEEQNQMTTTSYTESKEQDREQSTDSNHITVFCQKETGEREGTMFCHETRDLFRFCFWLIKWTSVCLSHGRNHKQKNHWQQSKTLWYTSLGCNNFQQIDSTQSENYCLDNQAQTYRITNHLRCTSQSSQEGILGVSRPTREDDPIDTLFRDRYNNQETTPNQFTYSYTKIQWHNKPVKKGQIECLEWHREEQPVGRFQWQYTFFQDLFNTICNLKNMLK